MDRSPREDIWRSIEEDERDELLDRAAVLHGHHCPGLALGVLGAVQGVKKMRAEHQGMEEVLAIVETNNCSSDGVQFITGCTFGNNSLIFRDLGKTAVTLVKRDEKKGIRFAVRSDAGDLWREKYPEYRELFEKVVEKREGREEDRKRMNEVARKVSHHIVNLDPERVFKISEVEVSLPDYAPIHESYLCEGCGEKVMSTRTVERHGDVYCLSCAGEDYFELTGWGISGGGGG